MTQAALAAKLHVTDKAVSKWERDLSYPDISLLPRIAEILGVSVSELIYAADDGGEPEQLRHIYRVSEDISTPIHIILGCTDLVERYADDPESRRRYLELIRTSARYMLEGCEHLRRTEVKVDDQTFSDPFIGKSDGTDINTISLDELVKQYL